LLQSVVPRRAKTRSGHEVLRAICHTKNIEGGAVPPHPLRLAWKSCPAMVLNRRLRNGVALESLTLETVSPQVLIGFMGFTFVNPVQG